MISVDKYNPGVAFWKLVACFSVVSLHFGSQGFGRRMAVPSFIFLAFYLSGARLIQNDFSYLSKRLCRLAIPFFAWGALGLLAYSIEFGWSWSALINQFLFGRAVSAVNGDWSHGVPAGHLYYLELVALITIVIYAFSKLVHRLSPLLVGLSVAAFALQYSGTNSYLWGKTSYDAANTFGRFAEFLPYACTGLLLSVKEGAFSHRVMLSSSIASVIVFTALYVWRPTSMADGFSYQGFILFGLAASFCTMAIAMGKSSWLRGFKLCELLARVSTLTSGIYFAHVIVGTVFVRLLKLVPSLILTAIVFAVSALLVLLLFRFKPTSWLVK